MYGTYGIYRLVNVRSHTNTVFLTSGLQDGGDCYCGSMYGTYGIYRRVNVRSHTNTVI